MSQRDEVADVCETVAGAVESGATADIVLEVSDLRYRYRPTVQAGVFEPVPLGLLRPALLGRRYDVVLIHEPLPLMHLALALLFRASGATVVHQPINMISRSYQRGSWFAPRSWLFRRVRPALVGLASRLWRWASHGFLCLSAHEVDDSGLPEERSRIVRTPRPPTGLAAASLAMAADGSTPSYTAPIAFINRFEWHRKGFDRLCTWLESQADDLPKPAVLLLAPKPVEVPKRLQRLVRAGLVEWNHSATGRSLHGELMRCRGLLLLSRYDGQSRVLREASLAGLPTVSTLDSHFSELVDALGCGYVVDGDDPAAIQAAFVAVADQRGSIEVARKLFDRGPVGAETIEALIDLHRDRIAEKAG